MAGVDGGRVQVRVAPAKQGQNVADIYLVERRRQAVRPARDRGPAARRQEDRPLPVDLNNAEPGHYVATALTVPSPGKWTLRIVVRTSEIDEQTIDVPVQIR